MTSEQNVPAVAGPVERQVRPAATCTDGHARGKAVRLNCVLGVSCRSAVMLACYKKKVLRSLVAVLQ